MAALAFSAILASCSVDTGTAPAAASKAAVSASPAPVARAPLQASAAAAPIQNPILFVTQVPTPGDLFASRMSTFANHRPNMKSVPRGGDLMIRYPDGVLRNLTREAGYGMEGEQGATAIAVREPTVHWDGNKAVFSMLVGGPSKRYEHPIATWQLFEVSGLARGQTAVITKVAGQPTGYNNVSPVYASDDRILFTSDRPRGGEAHLYPQLDEYESTATVAGIYSLDPRTRALRILNHTPSGAFSLSVDSYGRVIFTRWDHLQRDQQADAGTFNPFDYASEAPDAANIGLKPETFPESRLGMNSPYGPVTEFRYNLFTPWQMNQDGTHELSLNHIGRHELTVGYLSQSFASDSALDEFSNTVLFANRKSIRGAGGLFQVREDPRVRGTYYAIYTREFGTLSTNQIVRITGAPSLNAEQMTITDASPPEVDERLAGGRFRNPLPLTSGGMVAAYTASAVAGAGIALRLHQLDTNGSGQFVAGTALTPGIVENLSWWDPDTRREYSGALWEIEPVEVVARTRPSSPTSALEAPEKSVLAEEGVDEAQLRAWMSANNLALIVTRNQTSRDRGDRQQPFNLQVPAGVKTIGNSGRIYEISHYQILQGNQIRGYAGGGPDGSNGRRVIAQPMASNPKNIANPSGPAGSVKIASDGSTAAFVPASRALSWQTTDANGTPVVRERVWVTMQPGEIRTCAGCHGENTRNQASLTTPVNEPEALRQLLRHWKQNNLPMRVNGSTPRVPGQATAASQAVALGGKPAQSGQRPRGLVLSSPHDRAAQNRR
ncbi:MAG TPA: hypothetical protein VIT22_14200 [Pseudoxanthomonas sp.]